MTSEALSLLPPNELERTARQRFRCFLGANARECVVALPHEESATSAAIPVELSSERTSRKRYCKFELHRCATPFNFIR